MGGGTVTPVQSPGYNTGTDVQHTNAAPVAQGGGIYTPKMGQPVYMGQYLPQADTNFINQVANVGNATPQMESLIQQYMPSMNSQLMQQPTNYSPARSTDLGNFLSNNALQMAPYESQALATGFDPQNALYARTAQQVQDQTRAAEAAAGVAATPYGAGVESQNMANFNLDWIQQQQARQEAGAATANQLAQGMGQEVAGGQQLAQAGPSFQTSMLSSLLGNTTTALNPQQVALSDYLSYMGQNQQAELTASQQNIAGTSTLLDFMGQAMGGKGGGGGGGGGGGMPDLGGLGQMMGGKGGMGGK